MGPVFGPALLCESCLQPTHLTKNGRMIKCHVDCPCAKFESTSRQRDYGSFGGTKQSPMVLANMDSDQPSHLVPQAFAKQRRSHTKLHRLLCKTASRLALQLSLQPDCNSCQIEAIPY